MNMYKISSKQKWDFWHNNDIIKVDCYHVLLLAMTTNCDLLNLYELVQNIHLIYSISTTTSIDAIIERAI